MIQPLTTTILFWNDNDKIVDSHCNLDNGNGRTQ
jgi:hypothetical protein